MNKEMIEESQDCREKKRCKICRQEYEEDESIGSEFDQCQDCWEAWCDSEWWKMLGSTGKVFDRKTYTISR